MSKASKPNEIRQSILDLRRIYPELSDERFAARYSKRYGVPIPAIKRVLKERMVANELEKQSSAKDEI